MTDIRRVQITGGASYMITLPKQWAQSVNLHKNDPVAVVPQPNGGLLLTVGVVSAAAPDRKVLNADGVPNGTALYRQLIGSYIAGHREIAVVSDGGLSGDRLQAVSDFTQTSIGMEITEEDERHIVIRDLMDHTEVPPMKNVRREYVLVRKMLTDVFEAADSGSIELLEGMSSRDTEVDRIHWLVQRQASIHQTDITLSARMGLDLRQITVCVGASKTIERMGDHAVLMAKHLSGMLRGRKPGRTEQVLSVLGGELLPLFDRTVQAWMERDAAAAEQSIVDGRAGLQRMGQVFAELPVGGPDAQPIGLLAGSVKRLTEYCLDLSEAAINSAMERESLS